MQRAILGVAAVLLCVMWGEMAHAETPIRQGFTLELGLGISSTSMSNDLDDEGGGLGVAPLSFSLGGFVADRWAIMFRAAGTSYSIADSNGDGSPEQIFNAFYGVVVQHWFNDRFFLSAGPGLTSFGANPLLTDEEDAPFDIQDGWGIALRGGYSLLALQKHSLRLALEMTSGFYSETRVIGTALNFEWQLF